MKEDSGALGVMQKEPRGQEVPGQVTGVFACPSIEVGGAPKRDVWLGQKEAR